MWTLSAAGQHGISRRLMGEWRVAALLQAAAAVAALVAVRLPAALARPAPCMTSSCEYDACERGNGANCIVAADLDGGRPQALVWLAKGCRVGDREACARLHRLSPWGETLDVEAALAHDETDCAGGAVAACLRLVRASTWNGAWARYRQRACDLGDAESCGILGVAATEDLYQTTQYLGWRGKSVVGTGRDPQRAEALLLRACALGRDDGCETAVAVGSHDPALRARLEAICGRPDSGGCRALARMLTHDDPSQALAWYAKGCRAEALAKDDPVSDSRRAECCLEVAKRLVPSDAARAIALLDLLCVNEKPWGGRACRILGESYVDGKVVPAQPAKAVEYFRRACRLDPERGPKGDSYSCARAREMRKKRG